MKEHHDDDSQRWDRGWEEHRARQLRRLSELPFAEKLEWLEDAEKLGRRLVGQANRRRVDEPEP